MKKKVEIITHGNTWIDTSTPIVCPECAGLNVKEDIYNNSEWRGPFKIGHSGKTYSCNDCNCCFKIDKGRTSIRGCMWDDLFFYIFLFTFILAVILLIISGIFWGNADDSLPLPMVIALITDVVILLISFISWLAAM